MDNDEAMSGEESVFSRKRAMICLLIRDKGGGGTQLAMPNDGWGLSGLHKGTARRAKYCRLVARWMQINLVFMAVLSGSLEHAWVCEYVRPWIKQHWINYSNGLLSFISQIYFNSIILSASLMIIFIIL